MAIELKMKIKRWVSIRAEECKNVAPLYSYALDRKLTLLERLRFRFHLLTCNACTNYVANLNFMHEVFQIQGEERDAEKLQVKFSDEAKERLKQKLKKQNQ